MDENKTIENLNNKLIQNEKDIIHNIKINDKIKIQEKSKIKNAKILCADEKISKEMKNFNSISSMLSINNQTFYEYFLNNLENQCNESQKSKSSRIKVNMDIETINEHILKLFDTYKVDDILIDLTDGWSKETFLSFSNYLMNSELNFISDYCQVERYFDKIKFDSFYSKYSYNEGIDKYEFLIALMSLFYKNEVKFINIVLNLFSFEDKNEIHSSEFYLMISSICKSFIKYFVVRNKCEINMNVNEIIKIYNDFLNNNKQISEIKENITKSIPINDVLILIQENKNLIIIIKKLLTLL